MPTTHRVVKRDGHYYLRLEAKREEHMLLAFDHGDPCCPCNHTLMFNSLYDHHQCHDSFTDGDEIETPHGVFLVRGLHVEMYHSETKNEAKARRARLRRLAKKFG